MNKNIGHNLKTLAKIIGIALFVLSALAGITIAVYLGVIAKGSAELLTFQILAVVLGLLIGALCYLLAWALYGFGQLVDDVQSIKETVDDLADMVFEKQEEKDNEPV